MRELTRAEISWVEKAVERYDERLTKFYDDYADRLFEKHDPEDYPGWDPEVVRLMIRERTMEKKDERVDGYRDGLIYALQNYTDDAETEMLKARLGHSRESSTLDIYADAFKKATERADVFLSSLNKEELEE